MLVIASIRTLVAPTMVVYGTHNGIIQSILDFDYAAGRDTPSIIAIVSGSRARLKLFWGDGEILIPVFTSFKEVADHHLKPQTFLNLASGSSATRLTDECLQYFPECQLAHIFAEGVPERHALELQQQNKSVTTRSQALIAGPSGVGVLIPGTLKLGAIGGVAGEQLGWYGRSVGEVAVVCSSGGMINEIMHQLTAAQIGISFAVSFGGDRFPITSPLSWLLEAEADAATKLIIYFGELGGDDEYQIAKAIKDGKIKKPVYAYIAGRYESKERVQFGHAKALAGNKSESAAAKCNVLRDAGVLVYESLTDMLDAVIAVKRGTFQTLSRSRSWVGRPAGLQHSLISAPRLPLVSSDSFTEALIKRLLRREQVSAAFIQFLDTVCIELIDHGPQVSGAVNTIVTTRAGKDMATAVAAGLLTIGDRFGGAMNESGIFFRSLVTAGTDPLAAVEAMSTKRAHIPGIGHLKYNLYRKDPRIAVIEKLVATHGIATPHFDTAKAVAIVTTKKKSNLILNIDGAVATLTLDYLTQTEGFTPAEIDSLLQAGFLNALFIIPRTVGFAGHYIDQRQNDEGLLRLDDSDVLWY